MSAICSIPLETISLIPAPRFTWVPEAGSVPMTNPLGNLSLNTSCTSGSAIGIVESNLVAASTVNCATLGIVYLSGPLERINLTIPPSLIFSPPAGLVEIITPLAISSLNSWLATSLVKPTGFSKVAASFNVPPTREGTVTLEPGPIMVHQPPKPTAIARISATLPNFLRGLRSRASFSRFIGLVISRVSSSITSTFFAALLVGSFRTGRSSSRLICCLVGSNLI